MTHKPIQNTTAGPSKAVCVVFPRVDPLRIALHQSLETDQGVVHRPQIRSHLAEILSGMEQGVCEVLAEGEIRFGDSVELDPPTE